MQAPQKAPAVILLNFRVRLEFLYQWHAYSNAYYTCYESQMAALKRIYPEILKKDQLKFAQAT